MKKQDFEISNLAKNANEALILAVLSRGERHGYQIAIEIEQESGGRFSFNHGTLYPILHKLEKDGLIKGTWKKEGGQRKRKYYTLTKGGLRYLSARKDEWHTFFTTMFEIIGS